MSPSTYSSDGTFDLSEPSTLLAALTAEDIGLRNVETPVEN